ncbi:hypothetical protein SBA7_20002 [Candidatus Sulfotelmatobacter sp. SbA7]|nr:hypothetical protein SBA7_20002 [Candidatus Sulfotelmatobacter sp. SbA7]
MGVGSGSALLLRDYGESGVAVITGGCRASLGWTAEDGCPYTTLDAPSIRRSLTFLVARASRGQSLP